MKIKAKKSLGQNFLVDKNIIKSIVNVGDVKKNNVILEVGPGTGNLTEYILKKDPKKFISYVKDRPYNDKRYSISSSKMRKIGWKPKFSLNKDLSKIIQWYSDNLYLYKSFK